MILGLFFTGCGEKKPEALAGDHKTPSTMEELRVTGKSGLFIRRDQRDYTLDEYFNKSEDLENFKIGYSLDDSSSHKLYIETKNLTTDEPVILSMGDIPIPIIQEHDRLYVAQRKNSPEPKFHIRSVNFVGFAPLFLKTENVLHIGTDNNDPRCINPIKGYSDSLSIYKADDNYNKTDAFIPLENACRLDYKQKIIVNYKECDSEKNQNSKTLANCSCYVYADETSLELPILDKESYPNYDYIIYDLTKLSKGYWALCVNDEIIEEFAVILVQ